MSLKVILSSLYELKSLFETLTTLPMLHFFTARNTSFDGTPCAQKTRAVQ